MQPEVSGFRLSVQQQHVWALGGGRDHGRAQCITRIRGSLDVDRFRAALDGVSERHEILRTTFHHVGLTFPLQRIVEIAPPSLETLDLRGVSDPGQELEALCERERTRPFHLASGPLWRPVLALLAADEQILVLTLSALCADAATLDNLVGEIASFYGKDGEIPGADEEPLQYADLCQWQQEILEGEESAAGRGFWRRQTSQLPRAPVLPFERARGATEDFLPRRITAVLEQEAAGRLESMEAGAAEAFLATCWQILLWRLSGAGEVITGARADGRRLAELASALGPLARTLPLRARPQPGQPFSEGWRGTAEKLREALSYQELFVSENGAGPWLATTLEVRRRRAARPAGGVLFQVERRSVQCERAKIELVCSLGEGETVLELTYDATILPEAAAESLLRQLTVLIPAAAARPETPVDALPLLLPADRQHILVGSQGSAEQLPEPALLYRRFEEQAERAPDALALAGASERVTYGELNERANRLSRFLLRRGLAPEARVATALERSPDLVVGLLAILKAGGVYVALDLSHPDERLAALCAEARVSWLLSQRRWQDRVRSLGIETLCLDGPLPVQAGRAGDPELDLDLERAACVSFTSGSTGRPKGVIATHRGIANYLGYLGRYGLDPSRRVLQMASPSVDASVRDLLAPLVFGATVILPGDDEAKSPRELLRAIRQHGVTDLPSLVPSVLRALADGWKDGDEPLASVRTVLVSGERLHGFDGRAARGLFGEHVELVNQYGPTEATMTSTWFPISFSSLPESLPVGWPIPNARLYLLDGHLEPVPRGGIGEVYLGGPGLARGYLGWPGATAERFVPDPFASQPGDRLYRTGDLARQDGDGTIEILGRTDHQLKIRGNRVEPGEIEAVLATHPAVREALVTWSEDSAGGTLVAHVAFSRGRRTIPGELRTFLSARLPVFLVPTAFRVHLALPRTHNGKIDRRAVAALGPGEPEGEPVAPATALEETISTVWREVLQVETVGTHDNFFDLGGHSLLLVRVHARLEEVLQRELSLVELYRHPNVRALADHLGRSRGGEAKGLVQALHQRRPWSAPSSASPAGNEEGSGGQEIAILGIAGRFPGAADPAELWRNLCEGRQSISFFSDAELLAEGADPRLLADPRYVRARGIVDGVDLFDAELFGFTPREAEILDPQHRLFLECTWEALEDAGYDVGRIAGRTGVFGGATFSSYLRYNLASNPDLFASVGEFQIGLAAHRDFLTTRVSYKLDLKGPSLDIQTACSTSLVAVVMACQSLLARQCDLAVAGGAAIKLPQKSGYLYQEGGQESSDGQCRAFDARADGSVFGNGVGVVVLKRLQDALRDGDPIRAVILGAAVNNDGSAKVGYTAPSIEGQAEVIAAAQALARVEPETIGYLEAHGTGTAIGDPIEIAALTQAFGARTGKRGFCAVGSLKPNIGHLSVAAGVAGLIKAVLCLEHRRIPPSPNFESPNPEIDFARSPFYVNDRLRDWPAGGTPRRAGVSAFGIGGTNAHVVLEEAPASEPAAASRPWHLLVLSARTADALESATDRLAADLAAHPGREPADVAYTLQVGRKAFAHRRAVVVRDLADARRILGQRHPRRVLTGRLEPGRRSLVMLCSGLGDQYAGMGRGLYEEEPFFRDEVDRAADLLRPALGCDLREVLYPDGAGAGRAEGLDLRRLVGRGGAEETVRIFYETAKAQPALFVIEHALARLWMEWGVRPEAVAGYSLGEYVAACLAGVFSLEEALLLIAERARLIEELPAGAMLAVALPLLELESLLGKDLDLAAVDGPELAVVAGPEEAIVALGERLAGIGATFRRLPTHHAFHSRMMAPAAASLAELVSRFTLNPPRIPLLSNVTGTWITAAEATDPGYWARHLCCTVQFSRNLETLGQSPSRVLLEVGPGQGLSSLALQHAGGAGPLAIPSLRSAYESQPDLAVLLTALGRLWLAGVEVDWQAFQARERRRRLHLPTYPFDRKRYWIRPGAGEVAGLSSRREPAPAIWMPTWKRSAPSPTAYGGSDTALWLLCAEPRGLGARVAAHLAGRIAARGGRAVQVAPADRFAAAGADGFVLRPDRAEDYGSLLDALGAPPGRIVHLWMLEPDAPEERGLASLLALARALAGRAGAAPASLRVVSRGLRAVTGEEDLWVAQAALLGCEALGRVFPGLACSSLDLALPSGDSLPERWLDALAAELERLPAADGVVLRNGQRWVRSFEAIPRQEAPARLRTGGVYLIVSPQSGFLEEAARALLGELRPKLVLIGPAGPSLPPILQRQGAEVCTLPLPTLDGAGLQTVVRETIDRFGALHGIFQSFGIGEEPALGATRRQLLRLVEAVEESSPDFCVLVSAVAGNGESRVQAAARAALLDTFAWQRSREGTVPWTSLVWHREAGTLDWKPLIQGLSQALSLEPVPQLVISQRDPGLPAAGEIPAAGPEARPQAAAAQDRPRLTSPYMPPRNEPERQLVAIWQELLGIRQVGIHDSFFELGGHSLQATVLLSRMRDVFEVELPLRSLFAGPTVAELVGAVEEAWSTGTGRPTPPVTRVPRDGELLASFAQQRLWFLDQMEAGGQPPTAIAHLGTRRFRVTADLESGGEPSRGVILGDEGGERALARAVYNLALAVVLAGPLDILALQRSVQALVDRHETLRTGFGEVEGRAVQRIAPLLRFDVPLIDLSGIPAERRQGEALALSHLTSHRPFDLTQAPLLRVVVLRLEPERHALLVTIHHIVSDGWSTMVLIRELVALYGAFAAGQPSPLPDLPVQYADFAAWQRQRLTRSALEGQLAYWRERLAGAPPLELSTDRPRPPVQTYRGAAFRVVMPHERMAALQALAAGEKVSLFMLLTAAFNALMTRVTGEQDVVAGSPVANRTRSELEGLIGPFVNLLVLRTDVSGAPSFRELIGRCREVALGAYAHQDLPFEQLVEDLQPQRDLSRSPLFQVMLNMLAGPGAKADFAGLALSQLGSEAGSTLFDLTLYLSESPQGLREIWEYNTDLFDRVTIQRLAQSFGTLLDACAIDLERLLPDLPLMLPAELEQVLREWNDTAREYPREACLPELFEQVARELGDAPAVIGSQEVWSYRRLDEASNRLARHLRSLGVGPETVVGIAMERSPELVLGILAILKAGGSYVPLDAGYPDERLGFMLADTGAQVVLVHEPTRERCAGRARLVPVDGGDWTAAAGSPLGVRVPSGSLAYVIYTSGSTGQPKGVAVPHRAIVRLVRETDYVRLGPGDRIGHVASISFDAATYEIWGALLTGAALVVIPREVVLSPPDFAEALREHRVTSMFLTSALFTRMAREAPEAFQHMSELLVGGEAVDPAAARTVLAGRPPRRLLNGYGPTESTTFAAWYPIREVPEETVSIPIGSPLANTSLYVLDRWHMPVPPGVLGELFLGGDGLARGYLHRPDLTAERFVPHPWGSGERLYRTGDLARRRPSGPVELLGRLDGQVKIRGFRVEPGEIEAALVSHDAVHDAVVLAREGRPGEKRLVAYVVGKDATPPDAGRLRDHAAAKLPDYMVPSMFVVLEALPLTANGKVDRRALPATEERGGPRRGSVPPRTELERRLCEIWEEVLGLERVGIEDSFFALGGHSLLAARVVSRVRSALGRELPLRRIFEAPTIRQLARSLGEEPPDAESMPVPPLVAAPADGDVPLSFAQQRLWFLDQLEPGNPAYNIPLAVRLTGELSVDALERTFAEVVRRHEALRTTFAVAAGRPVQVIADVQTARPELRLLDLLDAPEEAREAWARTLILEEAWRPFDLQKGPLLRLGLIRLHEREHLVLMTLHHIVSDGWSMSVLLREIGALYPALLRGEPAPLPELPLQYADFARWQRSWLQGEVLERQLAYWKGKLASAPGLLELPTDRPRPAVPTYRGATVRLTLPPSLGAAVQELCRKEEVTPFMLLLAAWAALLGCHAGQEDVVLGSPIAGRNRREIEDLIGFFVNTLVLRTELSGEAGIESSFAGLLGRVRDTALEAFTHQDIPFERLVEELAPQRDLAVTPLFQVMFALQNAPGEPPALPGLASSRFDMDSRVAKFDLTLSLVETPAGILGSLEYMTDLFDRPRIARMAGHLEALLAGAVEDPGRRLSELPLLSAAERQQVVVECNDTRTACAEPCLHELIAAQAARTPEAVAMACEDRSLTYRELDRLSNRLASRLRGLGVSPEVLVGVALERSLELAVALVAVLKAGGAYVPLDPSYPRERLGWMLADSRAAVLLSQEHVLGSLPALQAPVLCLEETWREVAGQSEQPPASGVAPHHLAYVIFTSGSSGRPKGVEVSQGALANFLASMRRRPGLAAGDVLLAVTTLAFDIAGLELFLPLVVGARVLIAPREVAADGQRLRAALEESGATAMQATPVTWRMLLDAGWRGDGRLKALCGGEALPRDLAQRLLPAVGSLWNVYGPTETTIWSTLARLAPGEGPVSIGHPLDNTEVYLLSPGFVPAPPGVAAELCIGGAGLARGYLGRPDLTAAAFIPDPFSGRAGARLYRTGDLARRLPGGALDCLGRIDHQIKVRGFRIELGEIEAALAGHPAIRQAVVTVRENQPGDRRITAYVVPREEVPPVGKLREHLARRLPAYMIPSAFVVMAQLPLTRNGKMDRARLPAPGIAAEDAAAEAPATPIESIVAGIWCAVLDLPQISRSANFFSLGGDSILSIRVVSLARERGLRVSVAQIFRHQTLAELAQAIDRATDLDLELVPTQPFDLVAGEARPRLPEDVEDAYPLTRLQAGMLYHMELAPQAPLYHNIHSFHLRAPFDARCLQQAVGRAVARHPALRTAFDLAGYGEPLQLVYRDARLPVTVEDLRHLAPPEQEAALAACLAEEAGRRFDLSRPPLLRFFVHRRSEETFQLGFTLCHPILDGWSMELLLNEIFEDYLALASGASPPERPAVSTGMRDFVSLELQALHSREHRDAWNAHLSGASPLELPKWQAPAPGAGRGGEIGIAVPGDLSLDLLRLARSLALPLKSVLLAAHLKVLSRLGDQDDVLTGLIGHGRPAVAGGDRACGMFLNTLPFRLRLPPGSWSDLVREVFAVESALLPVRRYPLAALQREWGERVMFETVFNYVHYHLAGERLAGGRAALATRRLEQTSFPWLAVFQLDPAGERVRGTLRFDEARFPAAQMRSVAAFYLRALTAMQQDPDAPHAADPLLSAGELQQILAEWNDTGAEEMPRSLHGLFEEQAARAPEAVAALCEDRVWTYAELDRRASRLAHRLHERRLGRGSLVAVCLDRGLEMLEALLGILKAGAAYVPIEPSLPPLRMRWILSTLGIRGVVTGKSTLARVRGIELPGLDHLVCLDAGEEMDGGGREPMRPQPPAGPDDLAYIIFTSGSTGTPKGVMVRHRPVVNLIDWARDTFGFGPSDRVLFVTRLDFDLSVFDIFGLLAVGGSVRIASPADLEEPERLVRRLQTERITFWDSAPAALQQLVPFFPEEPAQEAALRLVFLSGDWVPLALPGLVRQSFPGARVVALGGATEATVWSNFHRADEIDPGWVSVPYGRPIRNASYHVLDAGLQPQPAGTAGDLYIGGGCLAAGYAGDPSLTAEKFLPDPFGERDGGRLYRTGDRARYGPDGTIELLGRRDQQVKIRGFRIELGEIEAVLGQHPAVRETVVVVREDQPGHRRLVAYAVAGSGAAGTPAASELRELLRARLPEHMIPAVILLLPGLPLTPNGKVDRRALPAPAEIAAMPAAPSSPRTPLEELLAGLWAEALGRGSVGVDDGFFDLGGDSLGATRLVSRMRRACGVELPLRSLFEAPTPAGMAERVEALLRQRAGAAAPLIERVDRRGPLPLSFAQRRMWFIDQLEPGSPAYNLGSAVRLRGPLATAVLESSLAEVVRRHETLRTTFPLREGEPVQVIAPPGPFRLPVIDLGRLPEVYRQAEAGRLVETESRRPFDLAAGPLLQAVLLRLNTADHVLQLTMHHIICDGWSIQVLVREITAFYEMSCSGRRSPLPELPVQYADVAQWERDWLRGEVLETKLAYWKRQLAGLPGPLELPGWRPAPTPPGPSGDTIAVTLPHSLLSSFTELARREGATLFMCLLAVFKILLYRLSGRTDIVVGTDIANRTQSQTENLIGCFFNMLALRTDLGDRPTFRELLARIREVTLGAYAHQDVPFDKLVEELRPERSLGHSPLFNVLFVLQSTAVEPVRLSALAAEPFPVHNRTSKFDLALFLRNDAGKLVASWVYKTGLFEARAVEEMARRFQALLESVAGAPDARVDLLTMLTPEEEKEKAMDLKKREESSFDRFKRITPKPVSVVPTGDRIPSCSAAPSESSSSPRSS